MPIPEEIETPRLETTQTIITKLLKLVKYK